MPVSLYDLSVRSYLQTLGGIKGLLQRGLNHCQENEIDPDEIVATRLFADMLPFRFQIVSIVHHSLGAIEGIKQGRFGPPGATPPLDYTALQDLISKAHDALQNLTPLEVDELEESDVDFEAGDIKMAFTAKDFLLSFSLPNFHFHATTAYDILRLKGVPLGKRDYLGQIRMKGPPSL